MPFYEYECSACKYYLEALQKISDPPIRKCPSCKKQTLKRLMSAPAFRLKGGGWYETDFKGEQDKKRNLVESGDKDAPKETKEVSADKKDDKKDAKVASTDAAKPSETAKPAVEKTTRSSSANKSTAKSKSKAPAKKK